MTSPISQSLITSSGGTTSTEVFLTKFETRAPTSNDTQYFVGKRWVNTSVTPLEEYILQNFTSSSGVVSANWKQLGSSDLNINNITVDANTAPGTNPVVPGSSNNITITGAQVATGTTANVIRTDSLSANEFTVEIQRSTSSAIANVDVNGVSHFNSSHFSVDSNGFVSLAGGGEAIDSFTVPAGTSPVVPDGTGAIDLPAGNGFEFTGGTNAMTGNMVSPFTGNFTFSQSTAGTTESITVSHSDNTAVDNSAFFKASVAGTTQTGDAYNQWAVGSTRSYAMGPDTSDSQTFKITTDAAASVTPSSGTELLSVTSGGAVKFNNAYTFPTADGSSGQVLVTNGAGQLSFDTPASRIVQITRSTDTTGATTTAIIPYDDTIPQDTEGTSFLTHSHTPLNSNNLLTIEFFGYGTCENGENLTVAIFTGGSTDAIIASNVVGFTIGAGTMASTTYLSTYMTAGTTSPIIFTVRFGGSSGGNVGLNATSTGTHRYGAAGISTIKITEYSS